MGGKIDTDSDEHIKKLIITYKNNDTAIIEHKYCDIYNFEYIYSTTKNPASLKKEDVIKRITKGFKQSKIKPAFRIKLDKIISQALNKHGYSTKESFSIGLPVDQVIYHDNIEYGLEYTPGKNGVAASTLIFYMSIGGNE
ncbi:MAG TPA: hypothetical protein ENK04_04910 [Gammaproteobacteria bacterium]|nr:hypothetical protein [Gammaproteobacteria bacterium]